MTRAFLFPAVGLLACLVLVRPGSPAAAQEKDPPADSITPIVSDIQPYPTTLEVDGQKIQVTIPYVHQKSTVFVLPVWHVRAVRRLAEDSPAVPLKPTDVVAGVGGKGPARLEFEVLNLLENEAIEKAIQDKLTARIAQRSSKTADKLALSFAVPQIKPQSYQFTLIAPGRGDDTLPAEVPLSPDGRLIPGGVVRLTVDPVALKAVEKENGGPLVLAKTYLRVQGAMRVRFEETQVTAQVEFVRGAVTELRKRVSSIKDSTGKTPDVFVDLPSGGAVQAESRIASLARQSLAVTISSRSGADTGPILSMVQAELNGLLERQRVQVTDDNKRLAFLLENQVAITATVGEIKRLAKLDEKGREAAFKAAADDYTARRSGRASNYSGSLGVSAYGGGWGVKAGGSYQEGSSTGSSSQEDAEQRARTETAATKRDFDKLMKEFEGNQPTLSGITFDDTTLGTSLEQVTKTFKASTQRTGDTLHRWPLISLSGQVETALTPQELVRQFAALKGEHEALQSRFGSLSADHVALQSRFGTLKAEYETVQSRFGTLKAEYEAWRKAVPTPQQLADAKANADRLAKQADDLGKLVADVGGNLSKLDQAALLKLQKEFGDLSRRTPLTLTTTFKGHTKSVIGIAFGPRTRPGLVATASRDGTVKLWSYMSGDVYKTLDGRAGAVYGVAFSPDGTRLVTGHGEQVAKVWDVTKGEELFTLKGHEGYVSQAVFSGDGKRIATASGDRSVKVWDAETGKELVTMKGHADRVEAVAFSPDGRRIVTGSIDRSAKVWEAESGKELLTITGHEKHLTSASFSPDGAKILTSSNDQTSRVWDAVTGKKLLALTGHKDYLTQAVFSPDGKRIVTAGVNNYIRPIASTAVVWDAETGNEVLRIKGHWAGINCVAFSADSKMIATGSMDNTAKVWLIE